MPIDISHELEHVRAALATAPVVHDPTPHVYVESLFSDRAYARMLDAFPPPAAFERGERWGDPDVFFGNYERRLELNLPAERDRLPADKQQLWDAIGKVVAGPEFAQILISKFRDAALARFGDALNSPSFVDERLRANMMLDKHEPGYYLGPHTDRFEKVFTCVFYLPEREGLDHLGTAIYRPKQRDFRCSGRVHHDPALFDLERTLPFRPNSAYLFARSDAGFHGVELLDEAELQGSERRGFQVQYWERVQPRRVRAARRVRSALRRALPV